MSPECSCKVIVIVWSVVRTLSGGPSRGICVGGRKLGSGWKGEGLANATSYVLVLLR